MGFEIGIYFIVLITIFAAVFSLAWWRVRPETNYFEKPPANLPSKLTVPPEEIVSGGVPQDGIPSIDKPQFVPVRKANQWLPEEEPGIAVSLNGVNRFYPYQILVWHEIVNDTLGGQRILVTYCPLCLTGYVFDPLVKGERVEFGTSGKLWKANLVMYDRKTNSLWSQILGQAIAGELVGAQLEILASDQMRYGDWKKIFPQGEILSRDTDALRFYGQNPYGDYFRATELALSLARPKDRRLPNDALVFGIVIDGRAKAYDLKTVKDRLRRDKEVTDVFTGVNLFLKYDGVSDVVRMFKKLPDGTEERLNPFSAFWFAWTAAHPDTELYQ